MRSERFAPLDRAYFEDLSSRLFSKLGPQEMLLTELVAERSQFVRVNGAKVRQAGLVDDGILDLTLIHKSQAGLRKATRSIHLSGLSYTDRDEALRALEVLQREVPTLPVDPYAIEPLGESDVRPSSQEAKGALLEPEAAIDELLLPLQGADVAGIYAAGPSARGMANSAGLRHWFSTETFSFDYSLYTPSQRALKDTYSGSRFDRQAYRSNLEDAQRKLKLLETPARKLQRGSYRTYLAPAALAELIKMFSWGCVSEASIHQGDSPLRKMRSGDATLSPRFSLREDFSQGWVPRFNSEGELAPESLDVIHNGKFLNALVSSRSAREYGAKANGATESENLRAPVVGPGEIKPDQLMERLGTGLYLSNLHYLNWSDQAGGRVTGMTRYACFWVESGQIVAPIENMRFDDTLFSLLGTSLEDFTVERQLVAETGSYDYRQLGGVLAPGALIESMKFTL